MNTHPMNDLYAQQDQHKNSLDELVNQIKSDNEQDQLVEAPLNDTFDNEIEQMQRNIELKARNKAEKIVKKNKREINRLKNHAETALIEGNYISYRYAIIKLRKIYRIKYDEQTIKMMWKTSRDTLFEIIKKHE